jgi:hypothetical protein
MINEDQVYSYFDDHHGPLEPSTNGWYEGVCPYCGSRKLYIQPEYMKVKCYKGCVKPQFVVYFVKEYFGTSMFESYEIIQNTRSKIRLDRKEKPVKIFNSALPDGYKSILDGTGVMARRAQNYLKGRGFDLNYLDMLGVGYVEADGDDTYYGYIIIPFRMSGEVVYFIARDYAGNYPRYKNPPKNGYGIGSEEVLFNEEALFIKNKVYMVEGWADAATIGDRGLSYQGLHLSNMQVTTILNSPVEEIVIVPDGNYYMEGLKNVIPLLGRKRVKVLNMDPVTTEDKKDVNAWGTDIVYEIEKQTEYISNLGDFYGKARSISNNQKKLIV